MARGLARGAIKSVVPWETGRSKMTYSERARYGKQNDLLALPLVGVELRCCMIN